MSSDTREQDEPEDKPSEEDAPWIPFPSRRRLRGGGRLFQKSTSEASTDAEADDPDRN